MEQRKGYRTPLKVVSSSYPDSRRHASFSSPRAHHSTALMEGVTQKEGFDWRFFFFFFLLVVFLLRSASCNLYLMWYLCCACLPPVSWFSPPVRSAPYQRAAASHSASDTYTHTWTEELLEEKKNRNLHLSACTLARVWPPSVDTLLGSRTRTYSWLTPDTSLGRYLTKTGAQFTSVDAVRGHWERPLRVQPTCHLGADLHVLQQHRQRLQILGCPAGLHLCQLAVHLAEPLTVQPGHKARLRLKLRLNWSSNGKLPNKRSCLTGLWDPWTASPGWTFHQDIPSSSAHSLPHPFL